MQHVQKGCPMLESISEFSGQVTKWMAISLFGLGAVTFEHKVALAGLSIALFSVLVKSAIDIYFRYQALKIERSNNDRKN